MRILHTMLRVLDLDKSIDFYTQVLGMSLLRRKDYPEGKFTLAFIGYGPEESHVAIELTHNWGQQQAYDLGNAYGHIAIEVDDLYQGLRGHSQQGWCDDTRARPYERRFNAYCVL